MKARFLRDPKVAKQTVKTETEFCLALDREDILLALQKVGYDISPDAEMYIRMPGGGDWSNMDLDVSSEMPLFVKWTKHYTTTK